MSLSGECVAADERNAGHHRPRHAGNDARFERKTAKNGKAYFILKASNGQAIGKSQMYASTASMEAGIESVKSNGPGGSVEDLS